jgi:hypothetical protein
MLEENFVLVSFHLSFTSYGVVGVGVVGVVVVGVVVVVVVVVVVASGRCRRSCGPSMLCLPRN